MLTAEKIAQALGGRRSGAGWVARCPAHADANPSLAICDGDGKPLVHCHAGCEQAAVIAALRALGLWLEPERAYTPAERRAYGSRRRAAELLTRDAHYFARAARAMTETALEHADYPDRRGLIDLLRDLRESPVSTYHAWRDRHPRMTTALRRAGRRSDARLQKRLARAIAREMTA